MASPDPRVKVFILSFNPTQSNFSPAHCYKDGKLSSNCTDPVYLCTIWIDSHLPVSWCGGCLPLSLLEYWQRFYAGFDVHGGDIIACIFGGGCWFYWGDGAGNCNRSSRLCMLNGLRQGLILIAGFLSSCLACPQVLPFLRFIKIVLLDRNSWLEMRLLEVNRGLIKGF